MVNNIMEASHFSHRLEENIIFEVSALKQKGISPSLTVVIFGENAASLSYFKNVSHKAAEMGIYIELRRFGEDATEEEAISLIKKLNESQEVDGILLNFPLPKSFDTIKVINTVAPNKDVDGFTSWSVGELLLGRPIFVPATARAVIALLENYNVGFQGKHAVVVGRSNIVGKPVSNLLLQRDCTVTICHSKTRNLDFYTSQADILIVSIGRARVIGPEYVKEGAVVVDVGINDVKGKIEGDVDFERVKEKASLITPVPGGVGFLTTLMLLDNVVKAAKLNKKSNNNL